MVGIVFLSALIGLTAAVSVLLSGASFGFAFLIYVCCGVAMVMTVVLLTTISQFVNGPAVSGDAEPQR
ncbi:hypothetical protein [Roseovarius sp. EL26]|uniref:hypothetical protein n=1 Tax=Roseovarius sp. EL26 TaxID=2126672 RepID=UPI000EA0BC02|nr:hypothetical protein [Roseovarius sp. EL26]